MLTKETRQKAEQIGGELLPLLKKAERLQKIYNEKAKNYHLAHNVARVWQWCNPFNSYDLESAKMTKEQAEEIAKMKEENPKQWHEELNKKYLECQPLEQAEQVARINATNYNNYICQLLAFLLRPVFWSFYDKKGVESLADYLNELTPKSKDNKPFFYFSLSKDGGSYEDPTSEKGYCYLYLRLYCSNYNNRGEYWTGFYHEPRANERPQEPILLTIKQYAKITHKINELEGEAKAIYHEQNKLIEKYKLHYFVSELKYPSSELWKRK